MYDFDSISNFFSTYWSYLLASYLLGAIPFGLILGLWIKKVDVRKQGSGNLGATNVTRVLGKKLGAVTLFLDALKGAIPVLWAVFFFKNPNCSMAIGENPLVTSAFLKISFGFAAFLGHCYPVYLKFKGGKGIATGTGVTLIFEPLGFGIALLLFIIIFKLSRKVSLSALSCAFFIFTYIFYKWIQIGQGQIITVVALMVLVIVIRHKDNIIRLKNGTETSV